MRPPRMENMLPNRTSICRFREGETKREMNICRYCGTGCHPTVLNTCDPCAKQLENQVNVKYYRNPEPKIHSGIDDSLPYEHKLAYSPVFCDACKTDLHAGNNECMQDWIE